MGAASSAACKQTDSGKWNAEDRLVKITSPGVFMAKTVSVGSTQIIGSRGGGILLHVSSLPGDYGIGDFGPAARAWIDQLAAAKLGWWQTLPLGPPAAGDSPYQCYSAFAGNP